MSAVLAAWAPPAPGGGGAAPPDALGELAVSGERPGPRMWHIHRGASHVWIIGSLSPLPKGIVWRAKQAEQVLSEAQDVLVQKPLDIGFARAVWLLITQRKHLMNSGGGKLRWVLPTELYARFARARAAVHENPDRWERYRPIIASGLLEQAAFERAGLSTRVDLGAAVRMLAQKRRIAVEEIDVAGVGDVMEALKSLTPASENLCVEAAIATIEHDLPRLDERARAWSRGDIERIKSLPEPAEVHACRAALEGADASAILDEKLERGGVSLAVIDIDLLLEPGGVLERLRDEGYAVE